nr:hypothetical protein CFP56_09443 [Quercus suber]
MIECLARGGVGGRATARPDGLARPGEDAFREQAVSGRVRGGFDAVRGSLAPHVPDVPRLTELLQFIPQLIAMQRDGRFPLERLCTTYDYRELSRAITDMHSGKVSN